jgi:hypothetical protein
MWRSSPDYMEEFVTSENVPGARPIPMPIVEVIVDKNKATGLKKTVYFKLEPLSGRMTECTVTKQAAMQEIAETTAKERRKQNSQRN